MALSLGFAAALIAANVSIHLESASDVEDAQVQAILRALEETFEAKVGADADERLIVRMVGGAMTIRLHAERCDRSGRCGAREQVDLESAPASWSATLAELAKKLFPAGLPKIEPPPPPPVQKPDPERALLIERAEAELAEDYALQTTIGDWMIGSGAGAAVLGGLGILISRTASSNAVDNAGSPDNWQSAANTGHAFETAGVALAGTGAGLLITAIVVYATRPE